MSYRVTLERDGEDLILPIPDELLAQLGWDVDTLVRMTQRDDGSILMEKVEEAA